MSDDLYRKILSEHRELSSLPQTLSRVLEVVRQDDSSAQELGDVLSYDPALTAKVLRAANSPYYGAGREIGTMSQAVLTLGVRAVTALALTTSIYDMTGKWQTAIDRGRFWRHSLEVAILAREIASTAEGVRTEEAFVSGLLHDIGMLVMESSFPEKYARLWKQNESGDRMYELEDQVWGSNHARVGQFLFEQWQLPSAICQAVGLHHTTYVLGQDEEFRLPQVVALANNIAQFSVEAKRPDLNDDLEQRRIIAENLGLSSAQVAHIAQGSLGKVSEEAQFLEIEIGSPEQLLQEANRMLYTQFLTVEGLLKENQKMRDEIAQSKLRRAALETLKTITATLNHYINNAVGTILGRAQLVELGLQNGVIIDTTDKVPMSMQVIIRSVETIRAVMEELMKLSNFDTTVYHDDTYIINIEERIRERLEELSRAVEV